MDERRIVFHFGMTGGLPWSDGDDERGRFDRPVPDLTGGDLRRLYDEMREVLHVSMRRGRIPHEPSWLRSRREERSPDCPRCRRPLKREQVAGRTTFWCPREQRGAATGHRPEARPTSRRDQPLRPRRSTYVTRYDAGIHIP